MKKTYLSVIMGLCLFTPQLNAFAFEDEKAYQFEQEPLLEGVDKGFAYKLLGDDEEEGVLKLFVKDTKSQHDIYDPTGDDLNKIAPAAGIQIHFDF